MSIREHAGSKPIARCHTCVMLEQLEGKHREELRELIQDESVTSSGIARGLKKELDVHLAAHSIRAHRRGECHGATA